MRRNPRHFLGAIRVKPLMMLGWAALGVVTLVAVGVAALALQARTVGVPPELGVRNGRLAPCPSSPNCVSTQADPSDATHAMPPLPLAVPAAEAQQQLRELLSTQPRVEVLRDEADYLHVVARSATMGFPDDVEFFFDEAAGVIHFRSASRLGQSDMGVNRARMEQLSATLLTAMER